MAGVTIRDLRKSFGTTEVLHGVSIDIDGRRVRRAGRPLRLRQVHAAAHARRPRARHLGRHPDRRRAGQRPAAQGPRHRDGVPELRALPAPDRRRQHGVLADAEERARSPRSTPASARPPRSSASRSLLERYPRQLSGGQRQRVAMGRAIVRDPQVFLFDEPLSNLDAKLRVSMRAEIKNLHQRLKTTTVYVTHDQIEAMTMADKIVVMHDGRVEQIGAPLELYDTPGQPLRRRLHRLAGDEHADRPGRPGDRPPLRHRRRHHAADRTAARRGAGRRRRLRPAPGVDAPRRRHAARPSTSSSRPARRPTSSAASAQPTSSASSASASARRPGEEIRISVEPQATHLFDAASGARIAPEGGRTRRPPPSANPAPTRRNLPDEQHHPQRPDGRRRRPRRRRARSGCRRALAQDIPTYTPEDGASLRMLRWVPFVTGEEEAWNANTAAFTEATGVEVRIDQESWEDVRPKAAVAANVGSGPDMVMSWFDDPFQYPDKLDRGDRRSPRRSARRTAAGTTARRATPCAMASSSPCRSAPSATPSATATAT